MNISQYLTHTMIANGVLQAHIPDSWLQGRTSYGGFSTMLAYMLAKSAAQQEDLPPLKNAQISFIGPLSGAVSGSAQLLRRGRNSAAIEAKIGCDAGHGISALFNFMRAMPSAISHNETAPPEGILPPETAPERKPKAPAFAQNFDWRFALPKDKQGAANFTYWVRAHDHGALDPAAELLLVADALPSAALALSSSAVPISSMNWMANILSDQPYSPDGWWLISNHAQYVQNGLCSQHMRVWNSDGALMADMLQSVAVFG